MNYMILNGELYHHGIKGQKWGVRRYQNADGSLTTAGQKRYSGSKTDRINAKIENAKNARQMEAAVQKKVKQDIRESQGKVSRFMHDISGYNNALAKQVVKDVASNMRASDVEKSRSKMSEGEKFADLVLGGSKRSSESNYRLNGYKSLDSEYQKYKSNGGIRQSKRNYEIERIAERQKRTEQMYKERQKQREADRRYANEKRKREEEQQQAIRNLNYQAQSYQNAMDWARKNKNNWY